MPHSKRTLFESKISWASSFFINCSFLHFGLILLKSFRLDHFSITWISEWLNVLSEKIIISSFVRFRCRKYLNFTIVWFKIGLLETKYQFPSQSHFKKNGMKMKPFTRPSTLIQRHADNRSSKSLILYIWSCQWMRISLLQSFQTINETKRMDNWSGNQFVNYYLIAKFWLIICIAFMIRLISTLWVVSQTQTFQLWILFKSQIVEGLLAINSNNSEIGIFLFFFYFDWYLSRIPFPNVFSKRMNKNQQISNYSHLYEQIINSVVLSVFPEHFDVSQLSFCCQ